MTERTIQIWPGDSAVTIDAGRRDFAYNIDSTLPYMIRPKIIYRGGRPLGTLVKIATCVRDVRKFSLEEKRYLDVQEIGMEVTYDDKCVIDGKIYLTLDS